jgi:hypothetical protein
MMNNRHNFACCHPPERETFNVRAVMQRVTGILNPDLILRSQEGWRKRSTIFLEAVL